MKTGFSPEQQTRIRRAKEILKHLCKNAGLSQKALLQQLHTQGHEVQQNTFSTWLSPKHLNVRPRREFLAPLLELCCQERSSQQKQEILYELNLLLGYEEGPLTPELIHNQVHQTLDEAPQLSLSNQQDRLRDHFQTLDALLDLIEPRIMDYGRFHPVIRLEKDTRSLVKQLLGDDKANWQAYEVEDGFEIPLTKIQSQAAMVQILDDLNESTRLLQRYLDRHLNDPEGMARLDTWRIDDYIAYAWEISDRLLHYNQIIKALPDFKRALLRQMTTCLGLRYLLQNQTQEQSEITVQNILALKSRDFDFDIYCSVAVFVGMLARQLLRTGSPERIQRALRLYKRAVEWLEKHHQALGTEQEIFHYKKELANLHYDIANFALPLQKQIPDFASLFAEALNSATRLYHQVLSTDNLFLQGLTPARRLHLEIFYMISRCWTEPVAKAEKILAASPTHHSLNELYWTQQIALAIAYGALFERSGKALYASKAAQALETARLVPGFFARTQQEIKSEYVLQKLQLVKL